jgi:ATP phosphoribosyltransferase regulatory subunit
LYHPHGQNCPGIGFSLNIETIQQVLQTHPAMPHYTPKPDWLVVATTSAAAAVALVYGQKLRSTPALARVEIYLQDGEPSQIKQVAIERGIAKIAWVGERDVTVEELRQK